MMTYETVKKETTKGGLVRCNSKKIDGYTLFDVYNAPSRRKMAIYDFWKKECVDINAYNFHITSHNAQMFCIGYETDTHYYHITPTHNYRVEK